MDITLHLTTGESFTVTPKDPHGALRYLTTLLERQNGTYGIGMGDGRVTTVSGAHIVKVEHDRIDTRI